MAAALVLPDADHLARVLKAARENGCTKLRIGTFEADIAPLGLVDQIQRSNPLPVDPVDRWLGRQPQVTNNPVGVDRQSPVEDVSQAILMGAKIVPPSDPTQAQ